MSTSSSHSSNKNINDKKNLMKELLSIIFNICDNSLTIREAVNEISKLNHVNKNTRISTEYAYKLVIMYNNKYYKWDI
jgi:hypothetical protein